MKPLSLFCVALLALASCKSPADKADNNDTSAKTKSDASTFVQQDIGSPEYCFVNTAGANKQDSTIIHFVIAGNKNVSGIVMWLPKGKQSQKGDITGIKTGDNINGMFTFTRGFKADTVDVDFKLSGAKLSQKPFKLNKINHKWETDSAAAYTLIYTKTDCSKLHLGAR